MSRQSLAPQRNLTLTEELEKLEQSITLTLQEIDHNFSRAHRIVTTSILPVVEQYGKHSEAVWEGSKFWKQFFEASANVSLSGYEAPDEREETTVHEHEETQQSQMYEDEHGEDTVTGQSLTPPRPQSAHAKDYDDTSNLDSPSLAHAHSTPRAPRTAGNDDEEASFADYSSPYEALRRDMDTTKRSMGLGPTTPGKTEALPDMSMLESSPFKAPPSTTRHNEKNPVLHHMLDKTYRIAATPLTAQKYKNVGGRTPATTTRKIPGLEKWDIDSSPPSSPAPQLRADIFSPMKPPRTPGVSVQTPAKGKHTFDATQKNVFDSDDEEFEIDFSPPKTMQFHIPQSRLLQTPAREASRRIVEDLLLTAGGDITESTAKDEDSPSIVRRQYELDDSF